MFFIAGNTDTQEMICAKSTWLDLSIKVNSDRLKADLAEVYTNTELGTSLGAGKIQLFTVEENSVIAQRIRAGHAHRIVFAGDKTITGIDFSPEDGREAQWLMLNTSATDYNSTIEICAKLHKTVYPKNKLSVSLSDDGTLALVQVCGIVNDWLVENQLDDENTSDVLKKRYIKEQYNILKEELKVDPNWNITKG